MLNRNEANDNDPANIYIIGMAYCDPKASSYHGFEGNMSSKDGILTFSYKGVVTRYHGNSGKVSDGVLFIDGIPVQPNDPRNLAYQHRRPDENKPQVSASEIKDGYVAILNRIQPKGAAVAPVDEKDLTPRQRFLAKCSPFTKQYIESFNNKKSHADKINEMKLSGEELALFDSDEDSLRCTDPVTMEVMNIPVKLFGKIYDFDTVLDLYAKNKQDIARKEFGPENLAASRAKRDQIEEIIKKIELARKEAAANQMKDDLVVAAPGGPGFLPRAPGGP